MQRRVVKPVWVFVSLIVTAGVGASTSARAANCGGFDPPCGPGRVVCNCGDTVTATYVLTQSLDCSSYGGLVGLKIATGVTVGVGAAGIQIIGNGLSGSIGVMFDGADNATLTGRRNPDNSVDFLRVTGWERGVQLTNGATGNVVEYVESYENVLTGADGEYGFDIRVGNSTNNVLRTVFSHDNGDEGIHFGGGSFGNRVESSVVSNNPDVQIYLTNTDNNTVQQNWMIGLTTGRSGLRINNSNGNTIVSNLLSNSDIELSTNAANSVLTGNTIDDGRLEFGTGTNGNIVNDLTVTGIANHCVEFSSNTTLPFNNRVTSSELSCTGTVREIISDGTAPAPPPGTPKNRVCDTDCIHQGSLHACTLADDVNDPKGIIQLEAAACP